MRFYVTWALFVAAVGCLFLGWWVPGVVLGVAALAAYWWLL